MLNKTLAGKIQLTGNPVREGATVTDETDDRPEDTIVTGGVVVIAVVEM